MVFKVKQMGSSAREMKLNPFEVHVNRSKFDVLGRKSKCDQGMPGISRNRAIQKRTKTLLQEYKLKDKSNQFIDQRIGERNPGMTEDDKVMARFVAERKKMFNKKTMFNLSEPEVLTHRGQTLSEIEKFDDPRSDDEEESGSSGVLKRRFVEEAHFGGGTLSKSNKDRESIIDDLINESKKRKIERQHNKEETLEATEQLDEEWKSLGTFVNWVKRSKEVEDTVSTQKKDNYDLIMRQLKFEPQGQQAAQRLKTEDEVAKQDKEVLEILEKERSRLLRETESIKERNHRSADDLDDGFLYSACEVVDPSKDNEQENSEQSDESDNEKESENQEQGDDDKEVETEDDPGLDFNLVYSSEEDDDDDEKSSSKKDESSDEESPLNDLSDLMPSNLVSKVKSCKTSENIFEEASIAKEKSSCGITQNDTVGNLKIADIKNKEKTKEKENHSSQAEEKSDLSHYNVPESFSDFKALIENKTVKEINQMLSAIVLGNRIDKSAANKEKISTLMQYIVEYTRDLEDLDALPVLVDNFLEASKCHKEESIRVVVDSIHNHYSAKAHQDSVSRSSFCCDKPFMKQILWTLMLCLNPHYAMYLFPLVKMTLTAACLYAWDLDVCCAYNRACLLLMFQVLLQMPGLEGCLASELVKVLTNSLTSSLISFHGSENIDVPEILNTVGSMNMDHKCRRRGPLDTPSYMVDSTRFSISCIALFQQFAVKYKDTSELRVLLNPLYHLIHYFQNKTLPDSVRQQLKGLSNALRALESVPLPPLIKAAKKPKALRQYEPAFHSVLYNRSKEPCNEASQQSREQSILVARVRAERKGAMRELRRDRAFLANVKLKERITDDEHRIRRVKEIFGSAAAQQGELRALKRKKM